MARHRVAVAWVLLVVLMGAGGCSLKQGEVHAATDIDARFVRAGLEFGLSLHRKASEQVPGENVFLSPASVTMALHMTLVGAAGDTRQAMIDVLGLGDMTADEVNRANADLLTLFTAQIPGIEVAMANSLWARAGVDFKPDFLDANRQYYRATVEGLDFDRPDAPDIINAWVSRETRGMIDEIIESIDADAVLFLINALYFKGTWSQQFDPDRTADKTFYAKDGSEIRVPMMSMSAELGYREGELFQAVRLPYGKGRMSMYVFLPAPESSLDQFLEMLDAEAWTAWMDEFVGRQVDLELPRFSLEFKQDLAEVLKAMGMEIAFMRCSADFSGMRPIPPNLFIGSVNHRSAVHVTEEGTEAAAATAVEINIESVMESTSMVVNRPFFFAIRDDLTGALLFTGSVVAP